MLTIANTMSANTSLAGPFLPVYQHSLERVCREGGERESLGMAKQTNGSSSNNNNGIPERRHKAGKKFRG